MDKVKVVSINDESLTFDNGAILSSNHDQDCCENHYLSLADITLSDFDGLEFDISGDDFFERIEGYGIALVPLNGYPVRVPGYGYNNGYYSSDLSLILTYSNRLTKEYDITNCQVIKD